MARTAFLTTIADAEPAGNRAVDDRKGPPEQERSDVDFRRTIRQCAKAVRWWYPNEEKTRQRFRIRAATSGKNG